MVAVAILWMWVFNYDYGLLNSIWKALTGHHGPNWLGDDFWVKVAMIIFMTWKGLGTSVILYLSGLQSILRDYYEAAKIDGASAFALASDFCFTENDGTVHKNTSLTRAGRDCILWKKTV
ncbi:MAG: sugar ABC transporter permease [Clostridiales bacterium]|nr:sugar ABC transporter permease [Clostridiales bacterium]